VGLLNDWLLLAWPWYSCYGTYMIDHKRRLYLRRVLSIMPTALYVTCRYVHGAGGYVGMLVTSSLDSAGPGLAEAAERCDAAAGISWMAAQLTIPELQLKTSETTSPEPARTVP
jgi:hypothetical protein